MESYRLLESCALWSLGEMANWLTNELKLSNASQVVKLNKNKPRTYTKDEL